MGRAHANPIMDTRMYQVDFTGDKVMELPANVIVESMYAQCDANRREYYSLMHLMIIKKITMPFS